MMKLTGGKQMQVNEAFWNVYKINLNWYITHNMLVQAYVLFKALFCYY